MTWLVYFIARLTSLIPKLVLTVTCSFASDVMLMIAVKIVRRKMIRYGRWKYFFKRVKREFFLLNDRKWAEILEKNK